MFKYKLVNYKPFDNIEGFYLLKDNIDCKDYFICSKSNLKYSLEIKKNGYIPKSGLIFDKLIENSVKNKKILDLGTGELGFLAIHSLLNGAKEVVAVDIDENCIKWLNYIIKINSLENIIVKQSDYFEKISQNEKFDMILSNPPQMPMISDSKHDSGGLDGRKYIIEILLNSINYLYQNSNLYILIFDFLGTNMRTNNEKSIFEIAKEIGYSEVKIIKRAKKVIREDSVTFDRFDYINNIYPKYKFKQENGMKYFYIEILSIKK